MRLTDTCRAAFMAALATAMSGTASGQAAIFSTLHGFNVSLSTFNGSPISSSASYSGAPTTGGTGDWISIGDLSSPNTGDAAFKVDHFYGWDKMEGRYRPGAGVSDYTVRFEWDVTFSSVLGGVEVTWWSGTLAALRATPMGGTQVSFLPGDVFANGRYIISWEDTVTDGLTSFSRNFGFIGSSNTPTIGAGGAVPVPGAAGLAAVGLAGLSRRRRR